MNKFIDSCRMTITETFTLFAQTQYGEVGWRFVCNIQSNCGGSFSAPITAK